MATPRLHRRTPVTIVRRRSERSAARLAHQSGGLGVPSSNLGAPTNHMPSFDDKTPKCRARRGPMRSKLSLDRASKFECAAQSRRRSRRRTSTSDYIGTCPSGRRNAGVRVVLGSAVGAAHRAGGPTRCPALLGAKVGYVDDLMGSLSGSKTRTSGPPAAAGSAFGCELAKNSKLEDD